MKQIYCVFIIVFFSLGAAFTAEAQIITKEDSLNAGLTPQNSPTVLSGYGEARYSTLLNNNTANLNLTRVVTFFGHKFNRNISFFSETELEGSKVDGGAGGEISVEQAFLKLNVNRELYFTAGLFIPRIGIINENHLPTTYNGVDRTFLEQTLIPATWREIGLGVYWSPTSIPGLNLSGSLMNGLNAAGFTPGTGLRDGRYEGRNASARNLAVNAAVLYYTGPFRLQASTYYGGSVGVSNGHADSLRLQTGTFGTPVLLNEANLQYRKNGLVIKALAARVHIADAGSITSAFANNVARESYGWYAEAGYDLMELFKKPNRNLTVFTRYEEVNMHAEMPVEGEKDPQYNKKYLVVGLTYSPVQGVTLKADFVQAQSGTPNPRLMNNPAARALDPYYTNRRIVNIGIGYSF
ncbi:MAG: hypothetical protein V4543_08870 [Bacteroidota bacterium]